MATKYAFGQGLRELRFHLSNSGQGSDACRCVYQSREHQALQSTDGRHRSFLRRAYPTMKHHNPSIPILIREATGVEPKVWARYGTNFREHMMVALEC
jgi:NADH dehydrogenase (ubiquinone) 1 alpha subcomplex subunit 2